MISHYTLDKFFINAYRRERGGGGGGGSHLFRETFISKILGGSWKDGLRIMCWLFFKTYFMFCVYVLC